jgi:hypothetical protein
MDGWVGGDEAIYDTPKRCKIKLFNIRPSISKPLLSFWSPNFLSLFGISKHQNMTVTSTIVYD